MRAILLAFLLIPGVCNAHWMHEWVVQEYKSAVERRGLEYRLTDQRVNLIVDRVVKYSNQYQLDSFEILTILSIESEFVNRIGDRHLPLKRWCFGYGQVQVQTASMVWGRHVSGWELINDVDLNIHTVCRHWDWLCQMQPDKTRAVRAYNAGIGGMRRGLGMEYLGRFESTIKRMERFYARANGASPT